MIVFGVLCGLFFLCEAGGLYHINSKRRAACQPTLVDMIRSHWCDLTLVSKGSVSRFGVNAAYEAGGRQAVADMLASKFSCKFDEFSIDYTLAHYNPVTKERQPGSAVKTGEYDAVVFFYTKPTPPPPPPKPEPVSVESWSAQDEKNRIDLFLAGPSAFWLSPDWSDPTEPFWMRDPAPVLSENQRLPAGHVIHGLSENQLIELRTCGSNEVRYVLM